VTAGASPRAGAAPDLRVRIGSLELANPVMPASGCFGPELGQLVDLNVLGALVTKTVFPDPRSGNPAHRLGETYAGMLNSVGIPSDGAAGFVRHLLPAYLAWRPPTIVSLGGLSEEEYFVVAERLAPIPGIAGFEVNVSCPNLEAGGHELGAVPAAVERVVRGVVERVTVPVLAKLTPNVTSIADIARAAENGGAAGVTAINAVLGIGVDARKRQPRIGTTTAGLTGPAIKPIALRCVWQASRAVSIPVIGVGGIGTVEDVVEFLLAGATAVQVGSATFTRPDTMSRIVDGLAGWLSEEGFERVGDLTGALQLGAAHHDLAGGGLDAVPDASASASAQIPAS
jgi:dihydroorotate dehydrogenase (NAD+) catalytic subunit